MSEQSENRRAAARERKRKERIIAEVHADIDGLLEDAAEIGDLKIVNAALAEMRKAFRVFSQYRAVRKVTTFGSARTRPGDASYRLAERFGHLIAEAGFMVITGAGPGIMEACQSGAGRERSFGVNIQLPFEQSANTVIHGDAKLISFKYFFTRKLFFVKEAHAVVLFPGGFGTHDEGFETLTLLQTGKCPLLPVVFLDAPGGTYWKTWQRYVEDHILRRGMISPPDLVLYKVTSDVEEAVREITTFYRVYHSSRYVRDELVLRLYRPLPEEFVAALAEEFADILKSPGIVQRRAFPVERDEPEIFHLPRLALHFDRVSVGRLRMMIDRINQAPEEAG
jgi:uncharacterized protein (TIGR00730 family)